MISQRDLDAVGSVTFLSCITCKVGCVNSRIHQNVPSKTFEGAWAKKT
jgi:hypothetical protein